MLVVLVMLLAGMGASGVQAQQATTHPESISYDPSAGSEAGPLPSAVVLPALGKGGGAWSTASESYAPRALECSINTACPAGDDWKDAARATVRILRGGAACSGVLVNNTRNDRMPYVLAAHHCGTPAVGQTVDWVFEFDYESPACGDPLEDPEPHYVTGAVVRAAQAAPADFVLFELLEPVPAEAPAHFAGWSIKEEPPAFSAVISHPAGDIKKIALDNDPAMESPYLSDYWMTVIDRGVLQSGSSGAPLFNERQQVVGLLRGAYRLSQTCSGIDGDDNDPVVYFPKLSFIWNQGAPGQRLSDFLDPDGQQVTSLPALGAGPDVWINEVNANDQRGWRNLEFIELAGRAGTDLTGFTLDVYGCLDGQARLMLSQPLAGRLGDATGDMGFYVLGAPDLSYAERHQVFETESLLVHRSANNILPDLAGIVILKDAGGREVFDYQYDRGPAEGESRRRAGRRKIEGQCPADRLTRSVGDLPGSGSMGFFEGAAPTEQGTAELIATPAESNTAISLEQAVDGSRAREEERADVLSRAYPNPFNPQTHFSVTVEQRQHVRVAVYDLTGRRIAELYDGNLGAMESRSFVFDAGLLPSGVYLVRVLGEHFTASQSVALMK